MAFGPEQGGELDFKRNFGGGNQFWRHGLGFFDAKLNNDLPKGVSATYVAKRLYVPTARKVKVSLGSDDGFRLFLNGSEIASKQVDRSLAADQDEITLELAAGVDTLVFKIVNTGGDAGFYFRTERRAEELTGDLVAALVPEKARWEELGKRAERAWRLTFSPGYRARVESVAGIEKRIGDVKAMVPLTMVMKELPAPRATFVLTRGQYDHPDKSRPVQRGIPPALGTLPDGASADRLGLAQWMTSSENPLVARVAVNRLWDQLFGRPIVESPEDFGTQGLPPVHRELLDWLAVEFMENGWSQKKLLRTIVLSATYRQSSRVTPALLEKDPYNRLLARGPRYRMDAEAIRDAALAASGLLSRKIGGPSVYPIQADMSGVTPINKVTTQWTPSGGEDRYRRGLYTYWRRTAPFAMFATFDSPSRECCIVRRQRTNTPIQALSGLNDPGLFDLARGLAKRALAEGGPDDRARIAFGFRCCTARTPAKDEVDLLEKELVREREHYRKGKGDPELSAWTVIANILLNLDETLSKE